MVKISIVIPIYNSENYLEETLATVLNQTYKNLEIILINDGSNDNSQLIIEKFLKNDERIKLINKKNGGVCSSRNEGLNQATGEYILHVDADDKLPLDTCENYIKILEKYGKVDIIEGNFFLYYEKEKRKVLNKFLYKKEKVLKKEEYLKEIYFCGKGTISVWGKLIKKSLYKDNKILHPVEFSLAEDGCTYGKLLCKSNQIVMTPLVGYYYRINPYSMTNKTKILNIKEYKMAFQNLKQFFLENKTEKIFLENEFKCKVLFYYYQLFRVSYSESLKENYIDYIQGYKELFLELKQIKVRKDLKNFNKKIYIILYIFKLNIYLGNFILDFRNKKKEKNYVV